MKIKEGLMIAGTALWVAVLLIGSPASPAWAGAATGRDICEGNGGTWYGTPDGATGGCLYPVDHPITLATCNPPEHLWHLFNAHAVSAEICAPYDPTIAGVLNAADCHYIGGIWDAASDPRTCTVSHTLFGECPGTTIYYADTSDNFLALTCVSGGSSSTNPSYGKFGGKIENDAAGSSHLGGNKNGSFYYNPGTCSEGCAISPNLPGGAASSLPSDALATLYVRLANDGNGSYTVCFNAVGMANPVIYRYVSGAWVAQAVFFADGQVCTTASGDGSFALGGT